MGNFYLARFFLFYAEGEGCFAAFLSLVIWFLFGIVSLLWIHISDIAEVSVWPNILLGSSLPCYVIVTFLFSRRDKIVEFYKFIKFQASSTVQDFNGGRKRKNSLEVDEEAVEIEFTPISSHARGKR